MQYEKVQEFFADSKKNGYKFALGQPEVAASKGFFIQPTIIDNPPNDSRIIQVFSLSLLFAVIRSATNEFF